MSQLSECAVIETGRFMKNYESCGTGLKNLVSLLAGGEHDSVGRENKYNDPNPDGGR